MSSLSDRITAASKPRKPFLREWLAALSPEDLAAATSMARDASWSNAAIVIFLSNEGVNGGKDAVSKWRADVTR